MKKSQKHISKDLDNIITKHIFDIYEYGKNKDNKKLINFIGEILVYWRELRQLKIEKYSYENDEFKIKIKISDIIDESKIGKGEGYDNNGFAPFERIFKIYIDGKLVRRPTIRRLRTEVLSRSLV